jgi:hypothetical protein
MKGAAGSLEISNHPREWRENAIPHQQAVSK